MTTTITSLIARSISHTEIEAMTESMDIEDTASVLIEAAISALGERGMSPAHARQILAMALEVSKELANDEA